MKKIIVRGGHSLNGTVKISGAKNAVLPIIAATLLASEGKCVIQEAPRLDDVMTINQVVASLGAQVDYANETVRIDAARLTTTEAAPELVQRMRASFLVLGPLLARMGRARIALPGGCAIGTRPIDQHLKGFEAMGAQIEVGPGWIEVRSEGRLRGAKIYLDVASVGATENIMLAASLAEGTTVIENAAMEPEIVDLANFMGAMGAKVRGAGTGVIRIDGVERLKGAVHTVIPDRIEAGTYMIAAAITGGNVRVEGAIADHLRPLISKLQEMGVSVGEEDNAIRVQVGSEERLKAVDIKTLPHPGFPTDLQSQMMALLLTADGTSLVTETIFENRFMHVDAFLSMSAAIAIEGRTAVVTGGRKLSGAKLRATDLRAGAALILAALVADGESEISDIHHIDRGYVDIVRNLYNLGADVVRIDPEAAVAAKAEAEPVQAEKLPRFQVQPTLA
ncbi:UDP-N-acetylglucosamine 1-carboxyvinyltransferase [Gorillibacterium timonense]|uniref:UDP-N-acetylglucosamine 1-carboxyvinyltransferase n=1 Tax=Gorillibacterium timonense TaxID=1689269 RepID=UPI00071D6AD6|nr:UDP-N-acetylglucosamine 1-carboxyvinyltransferase [Gorillibacterium timonense]